MKQMSQILIVNTSSVYLNVELKAPTSVLFLSHTIFLINSASYNYENKSANRGAQLVPMGIPTVCWKTWSPKTT